MNNIFQAVAQLAMRLNPNIRNNPQAQEYLNVIASGDSKKGQEIANNLCNTYGVTKDQAIQMAKQRFGIK